MKRIEKALLHNPDLCPFGMVARGEKLEEGEEKPKFEEFARKRPKIRSLTSTGVIRQLKAKEMGITCLVDHFGEDGPESYIEGSVGLESSWIKISTLLLPNVLY